MQPHVYLHAARSGEALETTLALKGLDTRVCFHVCCEGTLDGKSPEALFALERLLVCVDADVADKIAGLLELLGAVWAAMPANAILLSDGAWHLNWLLEDAPFLLTYRSLRSLYFLAFCSSAVSRLTLWIPGCGIPLRLDDTQPAVLQSLLQDILVDRSFHGNSWFWRLWLRCLPTDLLRQLEKLLDDICHPLAAL